MNQPIRLTNKTAIALRKSAARYRKMYIAETVILSVVMAFAALILGLRWLLAVPVVVIAAVLLDAAILISGRVRYLQLIGQAICTEAASREIRAGTSEQIRREQAISDLMSAKADVSQMERSADRVISRSANPLFERETDQSGKYEDPSADYALPVRRMEPEEEAHEDDHEDEPEETHEEESASPRRRRRQSSLQLIKSSQA